MELMIKVFLVEDEPQGLVVLGHLLARFSDRFTIVGQAQDAEEACRLIPELRPDLVLLDVQMPGRNGFSVLAELQPFSFEVIFVTSYEQYALLAIKFNALDYLLKPLDDQEFGQALEKAQHRIAEKKSNRQQVDSLLYSLKGRPQKLAVHQGDQVVLIDLGEVMYVEGLRNYSTVTVTSGRAYVMPRPIRDFQDYLGEGSGFIRISKGVLLQTAHISAYSKGEPCMVSMRNGHTFEVSRRKKQEVMAEIAIRLGR